MESDNFIILIRVSLCWTNLVAAALELELDRRFGQRTIPIRHKINDCAFAVINAFSNGDLKSVRSFVYNRTIDEGE